VITPSQMPQVRSELLRGLSRARRATQRYGRVNAERAPLPTSATTRADRRPTAAPLPALEDLIGEVWSLEPALREAELWWVAAPMTALAAEASRSLPEWTPTVTRPAPTGLLVWAGDTGVRVPMSSAPRETWHSGGLGIPQPPPVPVRGVVWWGGSSGHRFAVLTDDPRARSWTSGTGGLTVAALSGGTWDDLLPGASDAISALVGATWLLSAQPALASRRAVPARAPGTGGGRPGDPSPVTVVALREIHDSPDPSDTDHAGRDWHHQWVVRGHWRQQRCGPEGRDRRPTWVAPYVKGPEGAPLLDRPVVKVWRR